jgi:Mitochondrial pyruvate carriers
MAAPVATQSALQKFINSPAGPKTIHFWAPAMKWVRYEDTTGRLCDEMSINH